MPVEMRRGCELIAWGGLRGAELDMKGCLPVRICKEWCTKCGHLRCVG